MKTSNWKNLLLLSGIINRPIKVEYNLSDLFLKKPKKVFEDVETVIITMNDGYGGVFIGVAQTSPKDVYNKALGREIAAGRLLKAWYDERDDRGELWKSEDGTKRMHVCGEVPEGVDVSDEMIYN